MKSQEIRYELAKELARYFLFHLEEETKKPSSVSNYITIEGNSFLDTTKDMIATIKKEFPDMKSNLPSFNLFKHWWERNQSDFRLDGIKTAYADSTFKSQNQLFLFKILDIKRNEPLLRKKYGENLASAIKALRAKGRNIGFELILNSENKMYPILEIIAKRARIPSRLAGEILFEQNSFIHKTAYRIFDNELHASIKKTNDILNSIFPLYIVEELKQKGKVEPKSIQSASILFCDLVGFTKISSTLSPKALLVELDECYSHFDKIVKMHGLEKIKTIGDTYMAAAGILPNERLHTIDSVLSALKIQEFLRKYQKSQKRKGLPSWKVRIGIHCGPVVSGILGEQRFNYDIWGDSVNIAQRMEASSEEDKVNVSENLYIEASEFFDFEPRGRISVKGKGEMNMYFALGVKPNLSIDGKGRTPNKSFWSKYLQNQKGLQS